MSYRVNRPQFVKSTAAGLAAAAAAPRVAAAQGGRP